MLYHRHVQLGEFFGISKRKAANVTIAGRERLLFIVPNGSWFTAINLLGTNFCAAHHAYITYDYRSLQLKLSFQWWKGFSPSFSSKVWEIGDLGIHEKHATKKIFFAFWWLGSAIPTVPFYLWQYTFMLTDCIKVIDASLFWGKNWKRKMVYCCGGGFTLAAVSLFLLLMYFTMALSSGFFSSLPSSFLCSSIGEKRLVCRRKE